MKTFLKIIGVILIVAVAVLISLFIQNFSLVSNWFKAPKTLKSTKYNVVNLMPETLEENDKLSFTFKYMNFSNLKSNTTYKVKLLNEEGAVISVSGYKLSAETKVDKKFIGSNVSEDLSKKAYILTCNFDNGAVLTIQFKCELNKDGEYVNAKGTNITIQGEELNKFYNQINCIQILKVEG